LLDNNTNNIPNLFVIGAPKAGTTGFVAGLKSHPQIFVPNEKEPRFFDAHLFYDYKEDRPVKSLGDYLEMYSCAESSGKDYRVDGSVFNMYSRKSINNILCLSPDAKFIIILRDPLTAVKSMFSQRMKYISPHMREVSESFDECWQLMKARQDNCNFPKGCRNKILFRYDLLYSYERYIPFIVDLVQRKNLYIGSYAKLKNSPNEFYSEVTEFLGLKMEINNKIDNVSYQVKSTPMIKRMGELASRTQYLRKKLGLYGEYVDLMANKFFIKRVENVSISKKSDIEISRFFSSTYEYLNKMGIDI